MSSLANVEMGRCMYIVVKTFQSAFVLRNLCLNRAAYVDANNLTI